MKIFLYLPIYVFSYNNIFWQFCPIQVLHCVNKDVQFLIKSSDKYNWIIYMICASMRIFALIFLQSISYIFAACTFLKAAAAQKEGFVFLTGNGISWHWCPSSPCEWFWQESLRLHLKLFSRQCTFWSRQYMLSGDNTPTQSDVVSAVADTGSVLSSVLSVFSVPLTLKRTRVLWINDGGILEQCIRS